MFTSVMTCYAVKWMESPSTASGTGWAFDEEPETRHKVLRDAEQVRRTGLRRCPS